MSNQQFPIIYNGHEVEVTCLNDKTYFVQITYKPLKIQLRSNDKGENHWIDIETAMESSLTREMGTLITRKLKKMVEQQ